MTVRAPIKNHLDKVFEYVDWMKKTAQALHYTGNSQLGGQLNVAAIMVEQEIGAIAAKYAADDGECAPTSKEE